MGMELEGIIQDLKAVDADILILQELDVGTKRIGYFDSGFEIAQQLGLNYVFSCRKHVDGGYEGNGVMTKFDIVDYSHIHFNCYHSRKKHPKGHYCPAPVIKIGNLNIKVTSLHLDPYRCGKNGRIKQINEVIQLIKDNKRSVNEEEEEEEEEGKTNYNCSIIAGDFNTACSGLARLFYPELSTDFSSVFGSLFYRSEAQVMDEVIKTQGFSDPFYKGACGFRLWNRDRTMIKGGDWLYSSKLDWILLEDGKFKVTNKEIRRGHSDHMLVLVDVLMVADNHDIEEEEEEEEEEVIDEDEDLYEEFVLDEDKRQWVGKEKQE